MVLQVRTPEDDLIEKLKVSSGIIERAKELGIRDISPHFDLKGNNLSEMYSGRHYPEV